MMRMAIVVLVVILLTAGCGSDRGLEFGFRNRVLRLDTEPSGADVYVITLPLNGQDAHKQFVGKTPLTTSVTVIEWLLPQNPGLEKLVKSAFVIIEKDGFKEYKDYLSCSLPEEKDETGHVVKLEANSISVP